MKTMVGSIPMEAVLTMLNSFNRHDRRWLAEQMTAQVEREEAEAKKRWEEYRKNAPTWEEEDNARLDAFLAKTSGDWGGEGTSEEIARDLRQGARSASVSASVFSIIIFVSIIFRLLFGRFVCFA